MLILKWLSGYAYPPLPNKVCIMYYGTATGVRDLCKEPYNLPYKLIVVATMSFTSILDQGAANHSSIKSLPLKGTWVTAVTKTASNLIV